MSTCIVSGICTGMKMICYPDTQNDTMRGKHEGKTDNFQYLIYLKKRNFIVMCLL